MDEVNAPPGSAHATLLLKLERRPDNRPSAERGASAISEAGLLTYRSSRTGYLPVPERNSGILCRPLAAYSGATVRDSHPLPFSPAVAGEHLGNINTGTIRRGYQTCKRRTQGRTWSDPLPRSFRCRRSQTQTSHPRPGRPGNCTAIEGRAAMACTNSGGVPPAQPNCNARVRYDRGVMIEMAPAPLSATEFEVLTEPARLGEPCIRNSAIGGPKAFIRTAFMAAFKSTPVLSNGGKDYRPKRTGAPSGWIFDRLPFDHRDGEFRGYFGSCIDLRSRSNVSAQPRSAAAYPEYL